LRSSYYAKGIQTHSADHPFCYTPPSAHFIDRLAAYGYYNIDQVVCMALKEAKTNDE
jgi:UDP-galactopyranose mutase